MKECLRLRAPVPVVVRKTVKDTEVLGVRIAGGHRRRGRAAVLAR